MPLFVPAATSGRDVYTAMLGLAGEPFPIDTVNNDNLGMSSGFLLLSLIRPGAGLITNLGLWLGAAGTGPGTSSMALFSESGTQLATTGDMTAALTNAANNQTYVEAPLAAAYTAAADTDYYVGAWSALTADAKIAGSFSGSGLHEPAVKGNRPAVVIGGLGAMPSSVNISTATTAAAAYWLVAS